MSERCMNHSKWFQPRSISSSSSVIVRVRVSSEKYCCWSLMFQQPEQLNIACQAMVIQVWSTVR